jgi:hypothetical protein
MIFEWLNNLFRISDQIHHLKVKVSTYSNIDIEAQDARLVALTGMQKSVLHYAFWLQLYNKVVEKHGDELVILEYVGSNLNLDLTRDIMLPQLRLGLPIIFHFKLENFLKSLLKKISIKEPRGITTTYTELCKVIGIEDISTKEKVIQAFSSIRNSLHNNGIHTHPGFSIKLGDVNFEFEEDKVVQCASFDHIIILIQRIIELLDEIIESEEIKKINGIVPDEFSEWLNMPLLD